MTRSPPPLVDRPEGQKLLTVLAIGIASILVIFAIALVAYRSSHREIRNLVADRNLALGRTICNLALPKTPQGESLQGDDRRVAMDRLLDTWSQTRTLYDETYLCVIGPTGRLDRHSTNPNMVGNDVSNIMVSQSSGQTVGQLLKSGSSWSGENTNYRGMRQLVGYHYEPSLDSLVAIHVPAQVIDARFETALFPWLIGTCFVGGVLLPASLCLLYAGSRRATSLAAERMSALCESERQSRALADELRLGEERHRGFAENSSEGIYLCEFDTPMPIDLPEDEQVARMATDCFFAYCNDAFARMYGYRRGTDMQGKRASSVYGGQQNESNVAFLQQMVRNGYRVSDQVSEQFDRDHNRILFSNNCLGIVEDGHLMRLWGTQRNITDKWRAEQLILSENAILEQIADGQPQTKTLQQIVSLIESQSHELMASFWLPDENTRIPQHTASPWAEAVARNEQIVVDDIRSDANWDGLRDGARQHNLASCVATPISDPDGTVLGALVVFRQVQGPWSEADHKLVEIAIHIASVAISRQRAEAALRESENRFRTVFEQAAVGVAVLDSVSGTILSVNPRYCEILDTDENDLIGKTWMELAADEDVADDDEQLQRLRSGDIRAFNMEKRLRRHDGSDVWVNLSVSAMWQPDEPPSTHIAIVEDIDARKRADQEIRDHRETIAHMTRLSTMGEMVAELAHEVKQPLYTISNFSTAASVLLGKLGKETNGSGDWLDELKEWNRGTRDASLRASEIIDRLRDFTRKRDGKRHPVDLNQVVRESIRLVTFEARKCGAKLVSDLDASLPKVLADRIECEQVLVNLLQNAFDAVGEVNHERQIIICTAAHDGVAEVSVKDNGPGIDAEINGKLFDAFFTTKQKGMGMGLAISRTIVEDHGGRLWAQNEQPTGATFRFTLPAVRHEIRASVAQETNDMIDSR